MSESADGGMFPGRFPATRLRRNRRHAWLRSLVAETRLAVENLIWPLFVHDLAEPEAVPAMPGVSRLSIEGIVDAAAEARSLGIPAIALFPVIDPSLKTLDGSHAVDPNNLVCRCVRALRQAHGNEIGIICDVALDPYTSHGHDGLLADGQILNDATVEVLTRQAVTLAAAGCQVVAPSDMMDGRVGAIRKALDTHGHDDVAILSYAAKFASAFYGPFRSAVGSAANLGAADKKTYQMSPANSDEGLREVALDIAEGADMVMVKPAMTALDVIHRVKTSFGMPTFAYQVSGEYAMIHAAAAAGMLDLEAAMLESLLSIRRAGADAVLTYFAPAIAKRLASGS
ncbi:MAG: porphobilinogen synthase [Pirellulales bacterium]|nr:porphobilinogen synthase [Pirellulales bacterium]MBL7192696.1 porphobilinogen synthase [Pirellulales bacterium]